MEEPPSYQAKGAWESAHEEEWSPSYLVTAPGCVWQLVFLEPGFPGLEACKVGVCHGEVPAHRGFLVGTALSPRLSVESGWPPKTYR